MAVMETSFFLLPSAESTRRAPKSGGAPEVSQGAAGLSRGKRRGFQWGRRGVAGIVCSRGCRARSAPVLSSPPGGEVCSGLR